MENRILRGPVREFFQTPSPTRTLIANYVLDNLGKREQSVALCFRGDFATLYYHCHQLLRIRDSRSGIIGEFDFRHARFTAEYRERLAELKEMGVDISNFSDEPEQNSRRYVRFALRGFGEEKLEKVLNIYKNLIEDFIDPSNQKYAFDPKTACRKSKNLEKNRQQELYAAHFWRNDLMYYDLEYTEPRAAEKKVPGRFDLLGLRADTDGYTLLLTELKSTKGALGGKAGLLKHEKDYNDYINSPCAEVRKTEACEAVRLLGEMFGRPCPADLKPENIKRVKAKFVFSDEVTESGRAYLPTKIPLALFEKVHLENGAEKPY